MINHFKKYQKALKVTCFLSISILFACNKSSKPISSSVNKQNIGALDNQNVTLIDISSQFEIEYSHLETSITINPINPNNIVVASMLSDKGYNAPNSVIYYSKDAGNTWLQGVNMQTNNTSFPKEDPYFASDNKGNLFFSTLYNGFTIWKSTDLGKTWNALSTVPGRNYDREYIVADLRDSTGQRMYATGKFHLKNKDPNIWPEVVAISRSTNGGVSFSEPLTFHAKTPNEALNSMLGMHLTKKGTLLISYNRFFIDEEVKKRGYSMQDLGEAKIEVLVSEDNGLTFKPYIVGDQKIYSHGREIQSMKTMGLGNMASYTKEDEEIIYINWREASNNYSQSVVASSSDKGKTWSKPVVVSNSGVATSDVSNPSIAVNKDGTVLAVWNDRRNSLNNICFQVMGAFSFDNGKTFKKPFIIDKQLTCPCRSQNNEITEKNCRFLAGGDTQGLTALPNGEFALVFPSDRNNKMELFLAKIKNR